MSIPIFPGTDFDPVIETYAKGNALNLPALCYFDFRDAPQALWGGGFNLVSGGVTWTGLGKAGVICGIDGLEDSSNLEASDMTFTLSGVDASIMTVFKDEDRADYVGRMVCVYGQFCDVNWQPLCPPFAYRAGIMGTATVDKTPDGNGGFTRTITLPASNLFAGRNNAPASFFTDRDQKVRYPGDRFFEFVASIQEVSIDQPWR